MRRLPYLICAALLAALVLAAPGMLPASAAPAAQTVQRCDGGEGVYLYEGLDFTGACVRFTEDVPDLSRFAFNNLTSSVRIVGSFTGVLYVDQNYGNVASALAEDTRDLRGTIVGDNRGSALRVIRGYRQTGDQVCRGDGIYLYELRNFEGRCVRYVGDESDLRRQVFNNQAQSVRVVGGYSATLYEDVGFLGPEVFVNRDIADLAGTPVGARALSALRVTRGDQAGCVGDGVYLYENPNFQGRCLRVTTDVADLRAVGFDDVASSIRLVGGYTATLFRDLSFSGANTGFTGDDPNLADNPIGDNQATSIRVGRAGGGTGVGPVPAGNACNGAEGIYLYEHPNFQGACARFTSGVGDLRTVNFNDAASSVRIVGGWRLTLWRDLSGGGISEVFTRDDANLADNPLGDNQATSLAAERVQAPPPPPTQAPVPPGNACDGSEGAYLYEHPNFQGRCVRFTTGAGDLRPFGINDAASSVRIVGGWQLTLWRDLTGSGISEVFTRDDANLADNPIGDNQATSLAAARTQAPPPPPPSGSLIGVCDGSEGVYLYEQTDYRGACIRLTGDVGDLRPTGLNDNVESVRIFGRYSAGLYRDLNFTGVSSTFVESDPDLRNDGVGRNEATSVQVRRR